jgi:hypothetical protein
MAARSPVREERQRCLKLVVSYRESIERKSSKIKELSIEDQAIVDRVVSALKDIELNIARPNIRKERATGMLPGDFSIEEMEQAQAIIEEQEHNPFEV